VNVKVSLGGKNTSQTAGVSLPTDKQNFGVRMFSHMVIGVEVWHFRVADQEFAMHRFSACHAEFPGTSVGLGACSCSLEKMCQ